MSSIKNEKVKKTLVVILTWNKIATTIRCVTSVNKADGNHDILVIDNGSNVEIKTELLRLLKENFTNLFEVNDNLPDHAKHNSTNSRIIWFMSLKNNSGYAKGNNVGIRFGIEHGYQYSLISNNDIFVLNRGVISSLEKVLDEFPRVAWTSPAIVNISGRLDGPAPRTEVSELFYYRGIFYPLWLMFFRSYDIRSLDRMRDQFASGYAEPYIFSGSFGLFRNSALAEVSFFDENTFLYSEEEIIRERLARHGYGVKYLPHEKVIHEHDYAKDKLSIRRELLFLKSRLYYLRNYRGYSRYVIISAAVSGYVWIVLYYPLIFFGKKTIRFLWRRERAQQID
jgi:GT2 family glycosyltransferase